MSAGAPEKQQVLDDLKLLINKIKDAYGVEDSEIADSIFADALPLDALTADNLTVFESAVKYLRENRSKKFTEIAPLLQRSQKTVWATYSRACEKNSSRIISKSSVLIPLSIFRDNNYSPLESVVAYLLSKNLGITAIARTLGKAVTTISTIKSRLGVKVHE